MTIAPSKTPLSVDDLLLAKKKTEKDLLKPKFLSKSEREAQKKLAEEEEKAKKALSRSETQRKARIDPVTSDRNSRERSPVRRGESSHDGDRSRSYRDRDRDRDRDRKNNRGANVNKKEAANSPSKEAENDPSMPLVNRELLQARYLGNHFKDKRKIRKMSDKKFVFDWDKTDDTVSGELDPIYRSLIEGKSKTNIPARRIQNDDPDDIPLAGPQTSSVAQKTSKRFDSDNSDRHWSEKQLHEMTNRDWRIFKEDFSITCRGGQVPNPIRSWEESDIPQDIKDVIADIGYKEPSPIQRQAIPLGLANRDLIGVAETGSGKTAAFVIPMLRFISMLPPLTDDNRNMGPYALVLVPTRELAQQIERETRKFTSKLGYRCVSIVGGHNVEEQQFSLRHGAEIVIATPGRLKDVIERKVLILGQCTYVVLDEADRMVGLGFEEELNFILDSLPVSNVKPDMEDEDTAAKMLALKQSGQKTDLYRQTVMFSATMPPPVERLTRKYLRRPAHVIIGVAGQAVDTVEQRIEFFQSSSDEKKKARLLDILNSGDFEAPIIVFVNQKTNADALAKELTRARWSATTLHAGRNQQQREAALSALRTGASDILVATDLAGRGIDVPDVTLVVNFQMANNIESYIHRIGRTGRAGKTGVAITFLTNEDEAVMYDLKQEVTKSPISKCPPELARHEAAQQKMTKAMRKQAETL